MKLLPVTNFRGNRKIKKVLPILKFCKLSKALLAPFSFIFVNTF